jgi:hypothetical protein
MKTTLLDTIQEQNNTTNAFTANGAVTNKSSLSECVDYFGLAGGLRSDPEKAVELFTNAYAEDPNSAMKILFYLRDIRQGQGERRHFRQAWDWLMLGHPTISPIQLNNTRNNLYHIPEFGRWDDLLRLVKYPKLTIGIEILVREVLEADLYNSDFYNKETGIYLTEFGYIADKDKDAIPGDVSLLAKWMPSLTASNKDAKQSAKDWCTRLNLTQKQYRKMLKHLRSHINVVEQKMCSKDWSDINYSQVPSQAMLRLRKAFFKNDEERYKAYLEALENGETEVKAGTLYPYQLVEKVLSYNFCLSDEELKLINAQWLALPEYTDKKQNILTVCDVSGSMEYAENGPRPLDVAVSLTMYLASRCSSPLWANRFITFSDDPEFVQINPMHSMSEQAERINVANWGMNTDIQATFDLILDAAIENKSADMPDTIIIVSDMEFDHCNRGYTNFQLIDKKFKNAGLQRPNLVFWNVNASGSDNNVPVTVNDQGVALVSGFSPSIMQMCFSGDLSPESCLREIVLDNPRYQRISVQV